MWFIRIWRSRIRSRRSRGRFWESLCTMLGSVSRAKTCRGAVSGIEVVGKATIKEYLDSQACSRNMTLLMKSPQRGNYADHICE